MKHHTVAEYYYLDWVSFAITLGAFAIGFTRRKSHRELTLILYYLILSLIIDISTIYLYFFSYPTRLVTKLDQLTWIIFVWGEYGFLCAFIINNLSNRFRRSLSIAILISFYCNFIILPLFHFSEEVLYVTFSALYTISLIIVSLFYFYELFHKNELVQVKNLPPFWAIVAILFYASCSFPIFLFQIFLFKKMPEYYNSIFSINYFLYCLLYLLFIKAYLCKKKIEYA